MENGDVVKTYIHDRFYGRYGCIVDKRVDNDRKECLVAFNGIRYNLWLYESDLVKVTNYEEYQVKK